MNLQQFDAITYEVKINSIWIDISEDVLSDPRPKFTTGILDNTPLARVGDPETLTFSLRNDQFNSANLIGLYSPGHVNARTGWTTGIELRLTFIYKGYSKVKFIGTIDSEGIVVSPGTLEQRTVKVSCSGFMAKTSTHKLNLMALATNVRADQAVQLILDNMEAQPIAVRMTPGISTFPFAFDTLTENTKAMGEFQKLMVSELAYAYTLPDGTLVVESRDTRTDQTINTDVPLNPEQLGFLQKEDNGYLLKEDGGRIRLNQVVEANLALLSLRPGAMTSYGRDVANYLAAVTYPRRTDTTATTILFKLQQPIFLEAGETLTGVRGSYRDPDGGATFVNGTEMVTPTTPTHYQMFVNKDGTGTDLSANLTISGDPSAVPGRPHYGTDVVQYTLTNSGGTAGWVTKLHAVGKGIYTYDAVTIVAEDAESQNIHGVIEARIDMKYQADPTLGRAYATYLLSREKSPHTTLDGYPMFANYDEFSMQAFLYLLPGSRVYCEDPMADVSGNYFIMGYQAEIAASRYVFWSLVLKQAEVVSGWLLGTSKLSVDTKLAIIPFG